MGGFEAVFYDKPDGTEPMVDFLSSLDKNMRAKVLWTIALLESEGNTLRGPYSKHLSNGIFELRVKIGSDISRVLYFFITGKRVILTHGFIKKSSETPLVELIRAKNYRKEYLSRKGNTP
jgi:phage-related protein